MTSRIRSAATSVARLVLTATLCGFCVACRQEPEQSDGGLPPATVDPQRFEVLFPEALQAEDSTVNAFVRQLIDDSAHGDYDAFRLLWSARDEPLPRSEYEEGWQAVTRVEIRRLQEILLDRSADETPSDPEPAYVLALHVTLDPTHRAARHEAERDVVLMLVREHDEWRIARAPRHIRRWVRELPARPHTGLSQDPVPPQGAPQPP